MVTAGPNELGVMLVIFVISVVIPVWLTLFVRKKLPEKLLAGLALSFFFPFIAPLYLKKPLIYILIILSAAGIIKYAAGSSYLWIIIRIISALLMYYRFQKIKNEPEIIDDRENNKEPKVKIAN